MGLRSKLLKYQLLELYPKPYAYLTYKYLLLLGQLISLDQIHWCSCLRTQINQFCGCEQQHDMELQAVITAAIAMYEEDMASASGDAYVARPIRRKGKRA